jgi:hypothetical protein
MKKVKEVFLIGLFLINVIVLIGYLVLSYLKEVRLSDMNFTFLILYCITVNICFGEVIIKNGYGNSSNNRNGSK